MNLDQVDHLLGEIARERGVREFVVLGSLSVLGLTRGRPVPDEMLVSNEVDAYPERDPALANELVRRWGQGSEFQKAHGYYFDPISPWLPTLPEGWRARLIELALPAGARAKFLEPNDAAVSKYARGEPKDRAWIREGLRASILSLATLEYRFRETSFLDQAEHERVKRALDEDRIWLEALSAAPRKLR